MPRAVLHVIAYLCTSEISQGDVIGCLFNVDFNKYMIPGIWNVLSVKDMQKS